ncbi:hypothetical protein PAC01_12400 [Pediococcus acidilactici]|nr:hypothetical protein PAC01_12400 [Pediococcus acidilactici]
MQVGDAPLPYNHMLALTHNNVNLNFKNIQIKIQATLHCSSSYSTVTLLAKLRGWSTL